MEGVELSDLKKFTNQKSLEYFDVKFDGIYPNLIEIGGRGIITSGTHILSHFFNTTDRRFYAGKNSHMQQCIY